MFSQYFQDVDVYDNYGNHLGTFEVDSDYFQLQVAIEDAAEMAVDKYINNLEQKERKEQEIRTRQSWEEIRSKSWSYHTLFCKINSCV